MPRKRIIFFCRWIFLKWRWHFFTAFSLLLGRLQKQSRAVGFFSDFRLPIIFSGTVGNSLILEVGFTFLIGTWNENPEIKAYSGFFVFSDRYIALYVPTSDFFSSSRKWQIRLEIFKKVGFSRLFVAIVPEESRKSEKPTSENRPIVFEYYRCSRIRTHCICLDILMTPET